MKTLTSNQASVLAAMAGPARMESIEECAGLTSHAVSKAFNGLKAAGFLTKTGKVERGLQKAFDALLKMERERNDRLRAR